MKLKEIHRTSTFAWSPDASLPLLATGTVAGALDESFSNESQLEIWAPDFLDKHEFDLGGEGQNGPKGFVKDTARFNRITWGFVDSTRPRGVIAAGMENGELALWDPSKILAGAGSSESLILRNNHHTGPVRALDFNPIQTSLLSSGGIGGEVYIWDLKDPSKPYTPTPGSRSTKLDEITSVAWNQQVQYVLAGASSTGYTVVWDLRGKREVVALAYGGGAGTLAGQSNHGNGLAVGGRRGMSAIAWHPDNATRLVTASEDDSSPIIMVWDLRNARAPEKILTGHEKGVLSLSWCKQDADLLLSCGKDNRALCWNPQTSEIIGELPSADNWAFQVEWCPRNPDLLASAFFDGTVGIHSIQSTNESAAPQPATVSSTDGSDVFDVPGFTRSSQGGTLSLKQPPKWLRRPITSSFGFGGKLVSVSNLPSAQGKNQSSVIHLRNVVTEEEIVERAKTLQSAIADETVRAFAEGKASENEEIWKALLGMYQAESRDELVTLLGFSKSEIAARIGEAVEKLKAGVEVKQEDEDVIGMKPPVVSFAEPEREPTPVGSPDVDEPDSADFEKTPSEVSASAASDATRQAETESTTTAPSLFGDDNGVADEGDFFSNIGVGGNGFTRQVLVPHTNYGVDSSVAATIGSRPSSIASEVTKSNTFKIYPADESETETLVTKALVLGDFTSAVELCLSTNRFADALLLAVRGGPELLQKTQKVYFERQTTVAPYLRLFQSIVANDLSDIVQNADLQEWQEIFVVLCTFASKEEFPGLAEQLGRRLEFQYTISKSSNNPEVSYKAVEYRKYATLTYLAAARLERLVNIWSEELSEEEASLALDESLPGGSQYTAHAHALQTFIEKVTVFRSATKYTDADLALATAVEAGVETYKLSVLYDRYFEYADLLASQGLLKEAASILRLTPADYKGSGSADLSEEKKRLLVATSIVAPVATSTATASSSRVPYGVPPGPAPAPSGSYASQGPYGAPQAVNSFTPAANAYAPAVNAFVPPAPSYNPYGQNTNTGQQMPTNQVPPLAPPARGPATLPPPPKRDSNSGWNDAPIVNPARTSSAMANKPAAIMSPFPNSTPTPLSPPPISLPPPPRPGSVTGRVPPQGLPGRAGPPGPGMYPPPVGTAGGGPGGMGMPPPSRMMSPPQVHPPPPISHHGPPPPRNSMTGQTPPPGPSQFARQSHLPPSGPYAQATPPPMQPLQPPPPGPYGPPPGQAPQVPQASGGMYAPPPGPPPPGAAPGAGGPPPPPPGAGPVAPGDRSHIPDHARPAFEVISKELERLKGSVPLTQKRQVDDLERRINPLFDALNCETLSKPVVEQLLVLTGAMNARDRPAALAIHVDLLTRGSQTDDIGLWMSGVKQLIMRL
ncbi:transport protein [Lentinula novae-zelandiae]|nr:transport protein [Lentinula novae-zelandiae]